MISLRALKASLLFGLVPFLFSCATYNQRSAIYYKNIADGDYTTATKELDKIGLLQQPRNKLLLLMEKGRINHLNKDYENSNLYFNEADSMLENGSGGGAMDAVVGTLVNPMAQSYKAEDFEKFMIHYYKALNYLYLGKREDAIVEARRITLQAQEQGDKFNNKDSRYSKDAFSLNLQGLIYESDGDVNNAFIAYRNAADIYLSKKDSVWYGTKIPERLKYDLMNTAYLNGFTAELMRYENLFNTKYQAAPKAEGGELVIFWENGHAPVKIQQEVTFSLIKGENGGWFFTDLGGTILVPFDVSSGGNFDFNSIQSLRAAYPKYVENAPYYSSATISNSNFENAENINELAIATLRQRFAKEMSKVLTRLAVKKAAEYALRASSKSTDKNGKNNSLLEGLAFGVQLYSLISEKADTRNWQSLPAQINYTRIPLLKGENKIDIELKGPNGATEKKTLTIEGKGGLQFYNYATLK